MSKFGDILKISFGKTKFWVKKNSPELLIAAGIVGMAGAIFLACKSTLKLNGVVGEANKKIEKIHNDMKDDEKIATKEVDVQICKKELTKTYIKTGWELAKLYGPSAIIFGLSAGAIVTSNKIMKGRNVALAAAYSAINASLNAYRNKVREKLGVDAEDDIYANRFKHIAVKKEIDEKGKEKEVEYETNDIPSPFSDFTYIYDASNPNWSKSTTFNYDFLRMKENMLNQRLQAYGYLFLHEVYEDLGIDPAFLTKRQLQASRVLGWLYDENDPNLQNYVSLGLTDGKGNLTRTAMNNIRYDEPTIVLEFNPDGDILTGNVDKETGKPKKTFMQYAKM